MSSLVVLVLLISVAAATDSAPPCNCSPGGPGTGSSSRTSGYLPVTFVPNANPPAFVATVTFSANNEHDSDQTFTPLPPRAVNLTLDSSCNQIILPWQDCFGLRLQDICYDRSIACNATAATCGSNPGEPVFPSQAPLHLFYNGSTSQSPSTNDADNMVPVLCSSGHMGTAGIAPYRLSLVVQMHGKLQALNLPKMFGYCLGKPRGYFFVGQPNYVFRTYNNSVISASMQDVPTLRWDEDRLPVLSWTGLSVHGGDEFNETAPLSPSVFQNGLEIGTGARYLTLVDPAYQWLRNTMMAMANTSSPPLEHASSPFPGLDLCYTLQPNMSIDDGEGPQLELKFAGGKSWFLAATNFLVVTPDQHTVCLGAVSAGQGAVSSLGTLQQEELVVEYNFEQQMVSVSQPLPRSGASCGQLAYPAYTPQV